MFNFKRTKSKDTHVTVLSSINLNKHSSWPYTLAINVTNTVQKNTSESLTVTIWLGRPWISFFSSIVSRPSDCRLRVIDIADLIHQAQVGVNVKKSKCQMECSRKT